MGGFDACVKAARTALGITPFDEQLTAAAKLREKKIVEMKTGEGKTLSAVFAAYSAFSEQGRKTHILTFNNYLAARDYHWMKPVYDILGVKTALITPESSLAERQAAYKADVLYCTVKECGFDFLRDFLVFDKSEATGVADSLDFAIFDEADSVLIDEARIPLATAGDIEVGETDGLSEICGFVKTLGKGDYDVNPENNTAFLTDNGVKKAETRFKTGNLFDEENNVLLSGINACLEAVFVLERDRDYVVKDGKIGIIDILTGRIAENRLFPGMLQPAVELKHGLKVTRRGIITGLIPIQYFARQYRDIAGMTGTAAAAEEEFELLYGLNVVKIPPRLKPIRKDYPPQIYYDGEAKFTAVVKETLNAHSKNQPVLIGTSSVEESEKLSAMIKQAGIDSVRVLNAKNDDMEAEIIKDAGSAGAVTVSTNMAGRGVDIKLGGFNESGREQAVKAGGLLVIGTALYENARMNMQLNGRSGRQGDPGETRLFAALDDPIMLKYNLKKLIPARKYPAYTKEQITDKTVAREIQRIQRIAQGDLLEERRRMLKFTMISEKHRDIIFTKREEYLKKDNFRGKEAVLSAFNEVWCDYLEFTSHLRTGIHLRAVGGRNPAEDFNIDCENYFEEIIETLSERIKNANENDAVFKPGNTRAYLIDESGDELNKKAFK